MSELLTTTAVNGRLWLLPIEGMHCASCAQRLQKLLQQHPQIFEAQVHFAVAQAQLQADPALPLSELLTEIEAAGFHVPLMQLALPIQGVRCASCVRRIEQGVLKVPGVARVSVNPASGVAALELLPQTEPQAVLQAVTQLGFRAEWPNPEAAAPLTETSRPWPMWLPVALAAVLTMPLLLPMVAMLWGVHLMLPPLSQGVLATPVQFWLGARFYRGAWQALRHGSGNMDVLIALGTSAAYGLSCWQWFRSFDMTDAMPELYFEASATVITLVLLGRWLEERAKRQTMAAILALQALRPEQARVMRGGRISLVPLSSVSVGERVQVLPGERIPVDGRVLQGESLVDDSMLTGESLPVAKFPGEAVIGGALNGDGVLELRVEQLGAQSTLARIIQLVEQAQLVKPPVQRLVDRVSAVFVPSVVCIAGVTWLGWGLATGQWQQALLHGVAVLVVACPCALGLATPTAIMVGTGVAARHGILIRDVLALEQARAIRRVVFDKTGTLTQGKPQLASWLATSAVQLPRGLVGDDTSSPQEPILWLAAALGQGSSHPLGAALARSVTVADSQLPSIRNNRAMPGLGMQGSMICDGQEWELCMGGERLLAKLGLTLPSELASWQQQASGAGQTISYLVIRQNPSDWQLLAGFSFVDPVKPESLEAVRQLQQAGIQVAMLSGDHPGVVARVADALGMFDYQGSLLPQEKAEVLNRWRQSGVVLAMVGDGVNDAPALAASDVGIAMASGSDVAMQTASITLMRSDPRLVLEAIRLSKQTYAKIRQNLFWAFIYNVLGIPLAAAGLLNPIIAGAAMAFSSLCVVSNALLLRRWRATPPVLNQSSQPQERSDA